MEYTKGKWEFYKDNISVGIRNPKTSAIIAQCWIEGYITDRNEAEANAPLIASAVNACISINKDNPQNAAEAIKPMYEALREVNIAYDKGSNMIDLYASMEKVLEALALAEKVP